ncbi:PREDICTED: segment polarity protein dishevelled homolog DVL-3 [Gekko japonicus]|uniref:Segment polarity protein dishevelled homolog DVL-3 n=1 Tax=Gekko japonicus TaxID=146911 RepID=A0ABM1JP23_GEKJA|nr:PREDICTED: segment polarity protein dishevelled homolog DVL-3 [Gekko japonicus]
MASAETKIIYHLDDQETPYLVKLPVPAERVTLGDFKALLNRPNYKFYFKSMDDDFGVVKEEISDDNAKLPCFNGRVVSWLVSAEGSHSDAGSVCADNQPELPPSIERTGGIGDSRPPSFHPNTGGSRENLDNETETDSVVSLQRERPRRKDGPEHGTICLKDCSDLVLDLTVPGVGVSVPSPLTTLTSRSRLHLCRFSSSTEQSSASRLMRRHKRRRRKQKAPRIERSSSFSSITDSTMSLNIITVTLNMEKYNFLGISIVGQSNERGDGGIYIGSIMKGGAVAADGRIEPGDMLLQVNDINFENMSNDDAVRVLREIVHKPGPITLTVAKCWDPSPRGCFSLPRSEPIRPIDPAAWVSHTAAMTGTYPAYGMSPSMSTITSTSSSITSSIPETERSDVVDWLYHHVEGFTDRRESRKYASNLLKAGYIRHTVNKITFSEQCYYIFGDLCGNMANLSLHDHDGSSGASDQDTLAPLPHPGAAPWPMAFPYQYPPPHPYNPHPGFPDPGYSYGGGSAGSQHSEGSRSSGSNRSGSERRKEPSAMGPPGAPPGRDLASVPPELTASRQSFRMAMGNPTKNYGVFDFL